MVGANLQERRFEMAYITVQTTIDSKEGAQKIADALVRQRLAACVQIAGPIISIYWWQGQIEQAEEWVCTAKTSADLYSKLEQVIREHHTYETPEILATAIVEGNKQYLAWIDDETKDDLRSP